MEMEMELVWYWGWAGWRGETLWVRDVCNMQCRVETADGTARRYGEMLPHLREFMNFWAGIDTEL